MSEAISLFARGPARSSTLRLLIAACLAACAFLAAAAPADASFTLGKLRAGSPAGPENYAYGAGDTFVPEGSVDNGKWHRFVVTDSYGVVRSQTACLANPAGGSITGEVTYTVPSNGLVSGSKGWRYQVQQFGNSTCSGTASKTDKLYFTVAKLTAYADAALTQPTVAITPGSRAYVRVSGLGVVDTGDAVGPETDWKATWLTPSGTTACANTGGGDRPDSASSGVLPSVAGDFLQYTPNSTTTGDPWNQQAKYETRPCPATTTQGQWRLKLEYDATHIVTLNAFLSTVLTPVTIASAPASPDSDRQPTWTFSGGGGLGHECRLVQDTTVISDWAPCTSPQSYDLTSLPEGDYEFAVRAVAGTDRGPETTSDYLLDATAPDAPTIDAGPATPGTDPLPGWSFSAEVGAAVECRLDGPAGIVSDWTSCSETAAYDLSSATDGTYTFSVRATDAAGHTSPAATATYALDRGAPAPPTLTSHPLAADSETSVAWGFTAEPGAAVECRLERGVTVISDWTVCTTPATYDLASEVDGTYTFSARAIDAAGNVGAPLTSTYVLDRVAPAAPSITAAPASPGPATSVAWTFAGESGATYECRVASGTVVVSDWGSCTSPHSVSLAGQVDDTYTFSVRATDAAGNTGAAATSSYVLDRTAPTSATITAAPPSPGSDPTVAWGFSGDPGLSFDCRVERGATVVSNWASCSSPRDVDLTAQSDGTYTFLVRARDGAGNTSAPASSTYILDRAAPAAPTITDHPLAADDDASPTWTATAEAGAALQCRLERGVTVVADWAVCTGPATYDLAGEPDGSYTFSVRAVDGAGNVGAAATWGYVLDRVAPGAPSITAAPATPGRATGVQWSFSGEPGVTFDCRLEQDAVVVSAWTSCTSPDSHDLTVPGDGSYTFSVRAVDGAGNTSAVATSDYELDRVAPAAPTIDVAPPATGSSTTPRWQVSATDASYTLECRLERGAGVIEDWAACSSPHVEDLSTLGDATYTASFRARDDAGNIGASVSSSYTLDTTAAATPTIDGRPASPGNTSAPAWSFTGDPGSTYECQITRSGTVVDTWAACTSPRSYDLATEADGTYSFAVRAISAAGNTGAAAIATYTLDRVAPTAPAIAAAPASPGTDDTPTWSHTAEPGATVECRLDRGATAVAGWASCATPRTYDLSTQPDGVYTLTVRATDAAGNVSASTTSSYTLDRTGPEAPAVVSGPPALSRTTRPAWTFTGEPGAGFTCRLVRETIVIADWAPCSGSVEYDISAQPDGVYTFAVRATDGVGNVGAAASAAYVLDTTGSAPPHLDATPRTPGADRAPAWSFSGVAGETYECRLDRGPTRVADWAACASPQRYDLAGAPDAGYTFMVRAIDGAGNAGSVAAAAYDLDTTPPGPVKVVTTPSASDRTRAPAWAFTGEGGLLECRVGRGTVTLADWATCTSPKVLDLKGQPDGTYVLAVRETDPAGNRSTAVSSRYKLDTAPPAAPAVEAPAPHKDDDHRVSFSFATDDDSASFECKLTVGATPISDWAACTSPKTYDLASKPDGDYQFAVRATDTAGNTSELGTRSYTLDSYAPPPVAPAAAAPAAATRAADDPPAPKKSDAAAPKSADVPKTKEAPAPRRAAPKRTSAPARPAKAPAQHSEPERHGAKKAAAAVSHAAAAVASAVGKTVGKAAVVVAKNADKSVFPGSLIFVVFGFLGIQGRIDRSDPKLSLMPVGADQEVGFGPPPTLR